MGLVRFDRPVRCVEYEPRFAVEWGRYVRWSHFTFRFARYPSFWPFVACSRRCSRNTQSRSRSFGCISVGVDRMQLELWTDAKASGSVAEEWTDGFTAAKQRNRSNLF